MRTRWKKGGGGRDGGGAAAERAGLFNALLLSGLRSADIHSDADVTRDINNASKNYFP